MKQIQEKYFVRNVLPKAEQVNDIPARKKLGKADVYVINRPAYRVKCRSKYSSGWQQAAKFYYVVCKRGIYKLTETEFMYLAYESWARKLKRFKSESHTTPRKSQTIKRRLVGSPWNYKGTLLRNVATDPAKKRLAKWIEATLQKAGQGYLVVGIYANPLTSEKIKAGEPFTTILLASPDGSAKASLSSLLEMRQIRQGVTSGAAFYIDLSSEPGTNIGWLKGKIH